MLNTTQTATPLTITQTTARFVAMDIETGNAPNDAIERAIENLKPPANIKDPDKIAAKMAEMATKRADKAALLDASPILCIACKTDTGGIIFDSMGAKGLEIHNWTVNTSETEKQMLIEFRTWSDATITPDTIIAGHNCVGFDLPKIRNAYIRHRLQLPLFLQLALRNENSVEIIDTMKIGKSFSMQHRDNLFISLDTLADILNIERPKQAMSGAQVPAAFLRGEFAPILIYCCIDTETTAQAFQLMTGISPVLH